MSFLSHLHTDLRRARLTRRGATHDPALVPRGEHKEYPRMERITLPPPKPLTVSLSDAITKRRSAWSMGPEQIFTREECGTLFGNALGVHATSIRRKYPSGGALYPIEVYFIAALENLPIHVFHYHPTAHALEKLWAVSGFDMKELAYKPESLLFPGMIIFTCVWDRSSKKYGDFAYPLALLEAGHMSENLLLAATAMNVLARPMAGFNDEAIFKLLDIPEDFEQPIHSILLGKQAFASQAEGAIGDE